MKWEEMINAVEISYSLKREKNARFHASWFLMVLMGERLQKFHDPWKASNWLCDSKMTHLVLHRMAWQYRDESIQIGPFSLSVSLQKTKKLIHAGETSRLFITIIQLKLAEGKLSIILEVWIIYM